MIPDPPAQHPVDPPHPGLHIPAQGARAVEIVAGALGPLRLDVERIAHADGALNGDRGGEGVRRLGPPAMAVEDKADVSWLIRGHQQADDHPLPGIGLEHRRGWVTVDLGVKDFVNERDALQTVEKPFRAVVVALFSGVLVVRGAVGAFRTLGREMASIS